MSKLSDEIMAYRAKTGVSQTEFAKRCGVSYQTINSIENGRQDPSKVTKRKIELVLGRFGVEKQASEKDYNKLITNTLLSTEIGGINALLKRMDEIGYFTAPCSGGNHLAKEGGLAEHSWNVLQVMANLADALEVAIPSRSIILTALLHDLGKCGDHGKPNYTPNILKSGEQSKSKPYETNKDLLYIPHEVRSIKIASEYITLTEDEEWAILMHNGLYGDFKYSIQGKETPLYLLLHTADMWASRVLEVTK